MLYTSAVYGPQVSVGGLSFNTGLDSNGVEWLISEESGWYSTAGIKTTRSEKSSALGVIRMQEWKGGRSIAFNGTIAAPTQTLLRRAIDSLLGVCPQPDQLYTLSVTDESGVTYTANVSIDGQILTKAQSALSVTFSLQLFAPDPRRFGASHTATVRQGTSATGGVTYPVAYPVNYGTPGTTGATVITNNGTAYTDLVFTLYGPLINPVIRCATTGDMISYTGTIPTGAFVVIDTAAGSCLYGGTQNYRAFLAPNGWFTLPAKSSIQVAFSATPGDTGTLQIAYSDSYY